MHRTILLLGLFCLSGCGVAIAHHARDRALTDVALYQGTYPLAEGSMAPLMRCEDAADLAYTKRITPEDVRWFSRYAGEVVQKATDVDQGRITMVAWQSFVADERHALAPPQDRRMSALFAMLPAAPST